MLIEEENNITIVEFYLYLVFYEAKLEYNAFLTI